MAKKVISTSNLSAENLKNTLWDTLLKVKAGKMEPGQADAVACQSREILRTVSVQIRVASHTKRNLSTDVIKFAENT
jgi:hypothetical protein